VFLAPSLLLPPQHEPLAPLLLASGPGPKPAASCAVARTVTATCAAAAWPLQDIRLVRGLCTRSNTIIRNHPICLGTPHPPLYRLRYCARHCCSPTILFCNTCHTILALAISRKGQAAACQCPPGWGANPWPLPEIRLFIRGLCTSQYFSWHSTPPLLQPLPLYVAINIAQYSCISMLRYWSSLRYSSLRTLFLLAADLRRQPYMVSPRSPVLPFNIQYW